MLMNFLPVSARRILKEQMEQALSDTQHRLSAKNNELHAAHETISKLEDRIGDFKSLNLAFLLYCLVLLSLCNFLLSCASGEVSQHSSKHKEDMNILQKSIAALDREKDALQDEVDQKTEKVFVLQEENSKKVASAALCSHSYLRMNLLLFTFISIHSDLQKKRHLPFHLV